MMRDLLLLIVLSCLFRNTRTGRIDRLEKKIQGLEMSVLQDVYMLRENHAETHALLHQVVAQLNDTDIGRTETNSGMSFDNDNAIRRHIDQRVAAGIEKGMRRLKRAFVSQKMQVIQEAGVKSETIRAHLKEADKELNELADKVDNELKNSSETVRDTLEQVKVQVESQLVEVNNKVSTFLRLIEENMSASLTMISDTQIKLSETVSENFNTHLIEMKTNLEDMKMSVHEMEKNVLRAHLYDALHSSEIIPRLVARRFGEMNISDANSYVFLANASYISNGIQGRLQLYHNHKWGTVCDDSFDDIDASVVCSMMGYQTGVYKPEAYFGQGAGPIVLDGTACAGSEKSIFDCKGAWSTHDCGHYEDVGVICKT